MRKYKWNLLVFALLCALSLCSGQLLAQKPVSGIVKDKNSVPLRGVSVFIKGKTNGVVTNDSGRYTITVMPGDNTLVFSATGFKTVETSVEALAEAGVVLNDDYAKLDEVVVVGYGTQKRREVTGAVATIKAENFTAGAIRDVSEAIRGKVAGLNITTGSGNPSDGSEINLRGFASLQGSTAPLILINGIPGGFNTVAPEDIASIDVLKDASAAAIYGTRGANGVILITTKSAGSEVPTTVTYTGYGSVSSFAKKAKFLTADKMRSLKAQGVSMNMTDLGNSVNWLDSISQTGNMHNHNLSLKGGNRRSSYVANVNYNKQNGVFKKTFNEELKVSLDLYHYMFNDRVKLNMNVIRAYQKVSAVNALFAGIGAIDNPYRQAVNHNPTDTVRNADGSWHESTTPMQYYNPLALINETRGETTTDWTRFAGNIGVNILKGWDVNLLLSTHRTSGYGGYYKTWQHYTTTLNNMNGVASLSTSRSKTDNLEFTTTYRKNLGLHQFTLLGGYSYQYYVTDGFGAYNYNFQNDVFSYNNIGAGLAIQDNRASMNSYKNSNKLVGFLGRLNYAFDNRFNLMASLRREGSSKFGANHKWGNFSSVSAGWTISNEAFMKNVRGINLLKLRAGWGVTGIAPSSSYLSLSTYVYSGLYQNGDDLIYTLKPGSNPNPDLRWEKSTELNIGLDFSLLNDRLSGSVDVYDKQTKDLLWEYPVPTPPNFYSTTIANVGKISNKGVEILLNAVPVKTKNFRWNASLTVSHNTNKLLSLSNDLYKIDKDRLDYGAITEPISMNSHRIDVGKSLGNFYGFKAVDVTDDGYWIVEAADGKRKKLETTMYTQDEYKQYLGNGLPKFTGGFSNTFTYKRFDLGVVLTGAFGYKILNGQRMFYENPTIQYNVLESAYDKVFGKAVLKNPQAFVSYYLENGNYVKVDNITFGYSPKLVPNKYIKSLRMYASGSNLGYFTSYKGIDPEIARPDPKTAGIDDRNKYPTIKTFTVGVIATF
ncbi:TonB-linked outer membrane protein, SusC/RagA family [Filimonas lacunae]|uniref:TonB-linked outer membrane protein, SusC/RagA family n=1 Tax=Filimonas lacunae TaxID=477680 RepID=A0A173MA68_9BACT|nr:SusC/RagA family TonB-linked outer membrane protein [Filimonas lacunae]BAV04358.1 outer membrane protein SusC, starch binding [Filimonas lacunae]SIT31129.1 TonB-linked outer membrane protein, SusC/RagA family [Filimonas lacunae]